jgi:D-alanyl-D-alanine carboxypeptidase
MRRFGWQKALAGFGVVALGASLVGMASAQQIGVSPTVRSTLETIRTTYGAPALGGGYSIGEDVRKFAATGTRSATSGGAVTDNDIFALGSVTKGMMATMLAKLVEQGQLSWDQPIAEILTDIPFHPSLTGITLRMLVSHRAGISGVTFPPGFPGAGLPPTGDPVTPAQRRAVIAFYLLQAPVSTPGTAYEYSNAGSVIATYVAEAKTGKTFEQLIGELVWSPLGMTSCSVGIVWPSTGLQPAPHRWSSLVAVEAPMRSGNSRVLDGADGGRCSMSDLLLYAKAHAVGEHTGGLLTPASWRFLHTVHYPGQTYAAGWVVGGTSLNPVLSHDGTNTFNYARVLFAPETERAIVLATNVGFDEARSLTRTADLVNAAQVALNNLLAAEPPPSSTTTTVATTTTSSTPPISANQSASSTTTPVTTAPPVSSTAATTTSAPPLVFASVIPPGQSSPPTSTVVQSPTTTTATANTTTTTTAAVSTPSSSTPGSPPSTQAPSASDQVSTDTAQAIPGADLTVTGKSLMPGSDVVVELRSTPITLGKTKADAQGAFSLKVTVPVVEAGTHSIVILGTDPNGNSVARSTPIAVGALAPASPEVVTAPAQAADVAYTGSQSSFQLLSALGLIGIGGLVLTIKKRWLSK